MSKLDTLKQWLRDAYAMEQQSVQVLRRQSERLEHYPELGCRIEQHIGESERQGEVIQDCLNRLGDDNSAVKTGAAILLGNLQALSLNGYDQQ